MQVKSLGQGEISCNGTELFVRDRKKFELKKQNYSVFGGYDQGTRGEVLDREKFEIEGSQDRESPL